MLDYREDTLFILPGIFSKQMILLYAHTYTLSYQVGKDLLLNSLNDTNVCIYTYTCMFNNLNNVFIYVFIYSYLAGTFRLLE